MSESKINEKDYLPSGSEYVCYAVQSGYDYVLKYKPTGNIKLYLKYLDTGRAIGLTITEANVSYSLRVAVQANTMLYAIWDGNKTITLSSSSVEIPINDIEYYTIDINIDGILSHLADINWPYPTGTVHYFDKSLASSSTSAINNFVGANRFSGSIDSPNSTTTCTYTWPAHKNKDTSKSIIWNTNIVDTSKSNTCTIDMNNTYIDIVGTFYLKTTQTTSSTWTFAYIPASAISYDQCATPVWVSSGLWQDESGSFSGIYLVREGASGDTNMVGIRGIGWVRKDKATTGVVAGYANYFHIRLIPNQSAASTNYSLVSYAVGQN